LDKPIMHWIERDRQLEWKASRILFELRPRAA
jgi:hypothetical protein